MVDLHHKLDQWYWCGKFYSYIVCYKQKYAGTLQKDRWWLNYKWMRKTMKKKTGTDNTKSVSVLKREHKQMFSIDRKIRIKNSMQFLGKMVFSPASLNKTYSNDNTGQFVRHFLVPTICGRDGSGIIPGTVRACWGGTWIKEHYRETGAPSMRHLIGEVCCGHDHLNRI